MQNWVGLEIWKYREKIYHGSWLFANLKELLNSQTGKLFKFEVRKF